MEAYIVDDEMVLSGANLSEEYFDDRLDLYMLFANGGGGLVDFYAELCNALCGYAIRYDGLRLGGGPPTAPAPPRDEEARKRELELSLTRMFDGSGWGGGQSRHHHRDDPGDGNGEGVVAWAIPTIQIPAAFAGGPACVPSGGGHSEFSLFGPRERRIIGIRAIVERLPQSDPRDDVDPDHVR